jgi:hypothetical protein
VNGQICQKFGREEWSIRSRQPTLWGTVVPQATGAQGRKANGRQQVTLIGPVTPGAGPAPTFRS